MNASRVRVVEAGDVGLDVERHSCHGQDATVGPEQPGDQIEPGHRVVEQLPQGHDEEIADSVPGEGTVAVEPVLEDVTPGVPHSPLVTQCCRAMRRSPGGRTPNPLRRRPLDPPLSATVTMAGCRRW